MRCRGEGTVSDGDGGYSAHDSHASHSSHQDAGAGKAAVETPLPGGVPACQFRLAWSHFALCILHFAFGDGVAFAVDAPKDGKDPEGLMRNAVPQLREGKDSPAALLFLLSCLPHLIPFSFFPSKKSEIPACAVPSRSPPRTFFCLSVLVPLCEILPAQQLATRLVAFGRL